MSILCRTMNSLCKHLYKKEYIRFSKACNIENVQADYLSNILNKNANTEYGIKHNFADIDNYNTFATNLPLTVYDDYKPYIDKMCTGKENILTAEDVLLFELTSGSSDGKKLIPYTASLKKEFQRGIKAWIYDIYANVEGVCNGKSYWSITPVTSRKSFTDGGVPIGFEEDSEYFGKIEKKLMDKVFAVDSSVKFSHDMDSFYMNTAKQLLKCKNLSLISVWNPTFLSILCNFIKGNIDRLAKELDGKERERILNAVENKRFDLIFPNLKIISCWADGSAKDYISDIEELFPNVYIQPKGLLATECFVSFPLVNEHGSRLSIFSHFFEFRNLADDKIYLAHQLEKGEYELIVTTGGGLYRYCIGDIIEVLNTFEDRPPLIKFLRRKGITSDLFGEKLTEEFINKLAKSIGIKNSFYFLAPDKNRYCLYTTNKNINDEIIDNALCQSFHYKYCRNLGQLEKAKVVIVNEDPQKAYLDRLTSEGMRLGDIKPTHLSNRDGWDKWFKERRG